MGSTWSSHSAKYLQLILTVQRFSSPQSIPITAVDVNVALEGKLDDFQEGLKALSMLTQGPMFVCQGESMTSVHKLKALPMHSLKPLLEPPAGLVGTHIHALFPVNRNRIAWHIGYQDVVAVGRLFKLAK